MRRSQIKWIARERFKMSQGNPTTFFCKITFPWSKYCPLKFLKLQKRWKGLEKRPIRVRYSQSFSTNHAQRFLKAVIFILLLTKILRLLLKKVFGLKTKCHLESYDKLRLVHNLNSRPDPPSSGFNIRVAVISYPNFPRPREREISLFSRVRSGYEIRVAEQFRMRRKSWLKHPRRPMFP